MKYNNRLTGGDFLIFIFSICIFGVGCLPTTTNSPTTIVYFTTTATESNDTTNSTLLSEEVQPIVLTELDVVALDPITYNKRDTESSRPQEYSEPKNGDKRQRRSADNIYDSNPEQYHRLGAIIPSYQSNEPSEGSVPISLPEQNYNNNFRPHQHAYRKRSTDNSNPEKSYRLGAKIPTDPSSDQSGVAPITLPESNDNHKTNQHVHNKRSPDEKQNNHGHDHQLGAKFPSSPSNEQSGIKPLTLPNQDDNNKSNQHVNKKRSPEETQHNYQLGAKFPPSPSSEQSRIKPLTLPKLDDNNKSQQHGNKKRSPDETHNEHEHNHRLGAKIPTYPTNEQNANNEKETKYSHRLGSNIPINS